MPSLKLSFLMMDLLCIKYQTKLFVAAWGFVHIENKENLGRVASRKKLAEMSKYQYLLFIDADMIPKNTTFLTKYHDFALTQAQVVLGGYAYEKDGEQHEFTTLQIRNKKRREKSSNSYKTSF
jgi:hypothetical protein